MEHRWIIGFDKPGNLRPLPASSLVHARLSGCLRNSLRLSFPISMGTFIEIRAALNANYAPRYLSPGAKIAWKHFRYLYSSIHLISPFREEKERGAKNSKDGKHPSQADAEHSSRYRPRGQLVHQHLFNVGFFAFFVFLRISAYQVWKQESNKCCSNQQNI